MTPDYRERLINEMRQIQSLRKKKTSKLEAFKKEIIILRHFNHSYIKISHWLYSKRGISISPSQLSNLFNSTWKHDPFIEQVKKDYRYDK